ncbi:MAG: FAD-dependent oxidoreductase [Patescibacteria group bacterium]|nr:FAD-dependent oxidoreductase [Patescibacteria group bacterium]
MISLTDTSFNNYSNLMKYDVAIVGAGPAGLFAAYELTKNPKKRKKVIVIERGASIKKRKKQDAMCGVGGAGTFSDGKLHYTPVLSHEKILDIVPKHEYVKEVNYVEKLFKKFGVDAPYTPEHIEEAEALVEFCQKKGVKLYIRRCQHVGSDHLPSVIENMAETLKKQGVKFVYQSKIAEVITKKNKVVELKNKKKSYKADQFILCPGRVGARWLQKQAEKIGLDYTYQKVEIGVRVEFPAGIMDEHSQILHENIYSVRTPTYDDIARTFCPCPRGRVAVEKYGEYIAVNGYSNADSTSPNSNFNLCTEVRLTDPAENTTDYAILVAKTTSLLGQGKPIIQRLTDFRKGRRSTWKRIKRSYVTPTLKGATPGDISLAMPHRIVTNIIEGLTMLDRVLPGLNSGSTLIYAPEIKLRGSRIKMNKRMQTQIKNLYVAGDGPGASGNIVGAAATGILAAKGLLKNQKKK